MGNHGKVRFAVDENSKTLTVYEGGDLTGSDSELLRRNHLTTPFRPQTPLVADEDQLTSLWNAGQYREYWRWLNELCTTAETETLSAQAGPLAPMQDVMKCPVVIKIPKPPGHLEGVQRDLTLTVAKVQSGLNWKIDSWHDCPLIEIGDEIFAVTLALKTIEKSDDYMLRVAVLNDPAQYERVSGLREDRMIVVCKAAFEKEGWTFKPRHLLSNPAREVDGYATRNTEVLVVQLKSTLRPQSPWEVLKRNTDVLEGIRHTAEIVARVVAPAMGVVITDGYAGDYATWQESIKVGVPVATLDDAALIAADPTAAFSALAVRAGLDEIQTAADANERRVKLGAWTIQLIDQMPPE